MPEWISLKVFAKKNTGTFSEGAIRWIIYKHDKEKVELPFLRRIGKKIVISQKKFDEWLENKKKNYTIRE